MLNPNARLVEQMNIVSGILPLDLQTARTGDWVSMKGYERCTIVFFKAAGTAGDDPTITLKQTVDVADTGTVNKDLTFTEIFTKQGTLTSVGQFTKVTQAAGATYTDATSAEVEAIWVIDIKAEDLDVENGFDCLRLSCSDVGNNAQLGCCLYLLWPARYMKEALVSAIAD